MKQLAELFIGYWCAGIIGVYIGMLVMFLLSCLHHSRHYDRMIAAEKELQKYEDICAINDDV